MDEQEVIRDNPEGVLKELSVRSKGPLYLSGLVGDDVILRDSILAAGRVTVGNREVHVATVPSDRDNDPEVVSIAAVTRSPGLTQDYIDTIEDFAAQVGGASSRSKKLQQYWAIYESEGIVNSVINKFAAVLSVGGSFLVRSVKKGKRKKQAEAATTLLNFWAGHVNAPNYASVASSSHGLRALTEQGIRVALVEGDLIARQVWEEVDVPGFGKASLPMTIQTLSGANLTPITELQGLGEFWYWTPSKEVIALFKDPSKYPKNVQQVIKSLFDGDVGKQLLDNGKVLLDPALLLHIKHRGSDTSIYGESYIEPAKLGIRFSRSVMATDLVSMDNVINRLMIITVGSSDPKSPYSKSDVAQARTSLMQSLFADPGPNMTIVWQGDDVDVKSYGAMDTLLDLTNRYAVAERKIVVALGAPAALVDGVASDTKSAEWATMLSIGGMVEHLGAAFSSVWSLLGERILLENGFTDIDVVYQNDRSHLQDRSAERSQNRSDYVAGLLSIRSVISATGRDPDAEFLQRCAERGLNPSTTSWEAAFVPPQGLQGQGVGKVPGEGRPVDPSGSGA